MCFSLQLPEVMVAVQQNRNKGIWKRKMEGSGQKEEERGKRRVRKGIANICDIFPTLLRGKGMLIPENLTPNLLV